MVVICRCVVLMFNRSTDGLVKRYDNPKLCFEYIWPNQVLNKNIFSVQIAKRDNEYHFMYNSKYTNKIHTESNW